VCGGRVTRDARRVDGSSAHDRGRFGRRRGVPTRFGGGVIFLRGERGNRTPSTRLAARVTRPGIARV